MVNPSSVLCTGEVRASGVSRSSACAQQPGPSVNIRHLENTSPPDSNRIGLGAESHITSVTENKVSRPELLFFLIKEKKYLSYKWSVVRQQAQWSWLFNITYYSHNLAYREHVVCKTSELVSREMQALSFSFFSISY